MVHLVYLDIPDSLKKALGASDLNRRGSDERPLPSKEQPIRERKKNGKRRKIHGFSRH